ncbi:hypothetical protein RvY_05486 [Ramazzottius varieornatus]|uniref:SLIT-ROBO Rho GTPase-activating protein 1 n=1 Tax=Ramazzottius varieornatus TaxID=947166 RepID=A0A1D1UVR6_RAMVA|nr:hypothetical protein RvY_05486 [Ramazzottius varieornatus]
MAHRKDKETLQLYESQAKDIRVQLDNQLKCLDQRQEQQVAIVGELQDYFRRRADVELEHSKNLERLAKALLQKQKQEKQRRDQWSLCSVFSLYQKLVQMTKKQSRDHAVLGELLQNNLVNRLEQTGEDLSRIYRRCRDIGVESHEELFKVHNELHTALKTYFLCLNECRQTETKYQLAEESRMKTKNALPEEKQAKNRKLKMWTKDAAKKLEKYNEAKLKLLKARNEYLLSLNSANAALHKYFAEDLPEIMDCMDFGLHRAVTSALKIHQQAQEQVQLRAQSYEQEIKSCIENFDSRADKQKFIEAHHTVFMLPKKFDFHSQIDDEVREVTNNPAIQDELVQRFGQLEKRVTGLQTENEEIWKTLDTAERTLIEMIDKVDCDVEGLFSAEKHSSDGQSNGTTAPSTPTTTKIPETIVIKKKADKAETEQFYLSKFQDYILNSNLITRLRAKQKLIKMAVGTEILNSKDSSSSVTKHSTLPARPRRRRIAQLGSASQRPKLFGGSLEEYVEATNQEIPLIVTSCIRVIRQFGLHHQGIFRVSGSQVEINNIRDAFERGEDPLADECDGSNINSIAGVLKLYLRELREPLFPLYMFDQLMEISKQEKKQEFVKQTRELFLSLPRAVFVLLRYLIAFLNHLSEFSDENMMDRFNLAICFGPTLLPIPESRDQVQYQQRVNVLIKNIFMYQEDIFASNFGMVYEKYDLNLDQTTEIENDTLGSTENLSDEEGEPSTLSEDGNDAEQYEATAIYSFKARNPSELSVQKGASLLLLTQMNPEWWNARLMDGSRAEGYVPDKYVDIRKRVSKQMALSARDTLPESDFEHLPNSMSSSVGSYSHGSTTSGEDRRLSNDASTLNLSLGAGSTKALDSTATDSSRSDEDVELKPWNNISEQLVITEKTPREEREERRNRTLESLPLVTKEVIPTVTPHNFVQMPPSPRSPKIFSASLRRGDMLHGMPKYYFGGPATPPPSSLNPEPVRRIEVPPTNVRDRRSSSHTNELKGAPDLVLNLPVKAESPSYLSANDTARSTLTDQSPEATVAEQFARSNQGTMKKGETKAQGESRTLSDNQSSLRQNIPPSPNLNNFSLTSYEERKPVKYDRSASNPAASIDELLESLKAVASPDLVGNGSESPRPTVAPKPVVKAKPSVAPQKPQVGMGKKSSDMLVQSARDASSKPTSC